MPRNSQGQYFLPDGNPVVAGELVRAEWANSTLDDVANALTNSLDRAGAGGMTGQLKAASGTQVRPGISFVEDPATGIYKESQGVLAIAANGIKQAYATQNGLFVATAPSDKMEVANKGYVDALASQATEIILSFGISKTPADLPVNGYIPANWDATGSPAFAVQFSAGQSAVYRPTNTSDPLYNNVYVYVSTNTEATGWINIGTVAGPPGPQGEVGPMGPAGPQGPTGEQGPTGQTGPLGPVGPTGAQGPQGPQGAKGDTGPAGQSITIVGSFGVSKTPADLPSSGFIPANWDSPGNPAVDIQLAPSQCLIYTDVPETDPLYGHLYEYVGTGTGFDANGWVDLGDIQGPKGDTGPQGPQGIQGSTGPQGPAGTDGATGPQGPQGVQGDTGAKGDAGAQGPQGIKGDTGATGPQGPQGDTGPAGPAGGVNSVNGLTGAVTLNYNSVGAPSTTGTNASGTWPISVTGSAGSASTAATATNANQLGGVAAASYATQTWVGQQGYIKSNTANTYSALQNFNNNIQSAYYGFNGSGTWIQGDTSTVAVYLGASSKWNVNSAGNMGIAGDTAVKNGSNTWANPSDVRLKTDIQTLTTCLDKIEQLNPVEYVMGGNQQMGFVADEVELVIPSAVKWWTPPTDMYEFAYIREVVGDNKAIKVLSFGNDFFAYLVGAIKELKAEVDALKAQVNS